ncbi:MAG: cell division protein FtsZ [Peptostreptococcaceae bacterium]|nr:cell division protein FtsZ [Peptostreptococcaceae bacterium]
MFELDVNNGVSPEVIKVVGVGGGGGNAVNRMIGSGSGGVEYIVMNTDAQALRQSEAPVKLQLGEKTTNGRGAGADPIIGRESAEESEADITALLEGADMVFITAGMGGGTGTGAAPVVAKISKNLGILTVAVVTKPFTIEGSKKIKKAEQGIDELKKYVDTLIVIPNDRIFDISEKGTTLFDAFERANQVLKKGVNGITDIVETPGMVNVDFADIRATMHNKGVGHLGIGSATGEGRAMKAAQEAIHSPLLETTVEGAERVLISISATKESLTLDEFNEISSYVKDCVNFEDVDIIIGTAEVQDLEDEIRVAVIATGFKEGEEYKAAQKKVQEAGAPAQEEQQEDVESDEAKELEPKETTFQIPDWLNPKKKK